jgi:hypothetical protein
LLVVTATAAFAGAVYFHTVNNGCFVEEVVAVCTQKWRDVESGVVLETSGDASGFAQQLSEYSSGALLFVLAQSRVVGSCFWSDLQHFKPSRRVFFSEKTVI